MRIAIVHDWFVTRGGAERVVESMLELWPEADLFAVIDHYSEGNRVHLGGRTVSTTFLQGFPGARSGYRSLLPLMPLAIEQLDLRGYDLVVSSSHAVAKGVITGPDQVHVSYVNSPMRYAWDMQHEYLEAAGLMRSPKAWMARWILHKMRIWDYRTAAGVDVFVANSAFVARRIKKVYGRDSVVVYPPVEVDEFPLHEEKEDFYLCASRMVPYKRVPLVAEAFAGMPERRLLVIGDGPDLERVRAFSAPNVEVLGFQSHAELKRQMQRARAFVFAAQEDFGIMPLEAQACGTPVIAYGKGGALETVRPEGQSQPPTGLFFAEQSVASIQAAVREFEANRHRFSARACGDHARTFGPDRFHRELRAVVDQALAAHG